MVLEKIPTFDEVKTWVNTSADVPNADTVDGKHATDIEYTDSQAQTAVEGNVNVESLLTAGNNGTVPTADGSGNITMESPGGVALQILGASQSELESLIEDEEVADKMAASLMAMDAVAASSTAMDGVAASSTAMDAVAGSQTAMDKVVASQTAMDTVAGSQTAMDGVAASSTAMDAVAGSQTAMDAVIASQTAMDKVVASQTAMDGVAASSTAMDAVAASQTAMDAVAASIIARSAALGSSYTIDSIWSNEMPSETIWNQGSIKDDTDTISWDLEMDFSNYSTMEFQTQADREHDKETLSVLVNGTTLFETTNEHTWTSRSVDVSTHNEATLTFRLNQSWDPVQSQSLSSGPSGDGRSLYFQENSSPNRNAYFANVTLS